MTQIKTSTEILEYHMGGLLILDKYRKTMEGYNENNPRKKRKMVKQASESLFDYLYLDNSDYDNYGSIIQSLNFKKSLGNNIYPRKCFKMNNVLSNHKFDINKHKNRTISIKKNKNKEEKDDIVITLLLFAQMEGRC